MSPILKAILFSMDYTLLYNSGSSVHLPRAYHVPGTVARNPHKKLMR